ncbi:MAG: hypothetical protein QXH71_00225 [Candidatus Anstonellaceae archaeon]
MQPQLPDVFDKKESDPIERFKLKSLILNNLGPNGLRVYNAIDGKKTISEIIELLGLDEKEVLEIMVLLIKLGAIVEVGQSSKEDSFALSQKNLDIESSSAESPISQEEEAAPSQNLENDISNFSEEKNLSEAEKEIFQKFGKVGLKVFSMIDGYRSAQEIMEEVGINESLLIEILEFLNERGFITLEVKNSPKESAQSKDSKQKNEETRNPVSPMVEKEPFPSISTMDESYLVVTPKLNKLSVVDSTKLKFLLKFKYKLNLDFIKYLNGEHDIIDLFFLYEIPLQNLSNILKELKNEGYLSLTPLTRNEIEKKYGTIALSAYKKFGVWGLLLYNFIGKTHSLLDLVKKSGIDPKKASDILLFLSNVLGLAIKIDKEKLYQALQKS